VEYGAEDAPIRVTPGTPFPITDAAVLANIQTLIAGINSSEAARSADASVLLASISAVETARNADADALIASVNAAETARNADADTLVATLTSAEAARDADATTLVTSVNAAETARNADADALNAAVTAAEAARNADADALNAIVTAAEAARNADADALNATVTAAEAARNSDSDDLISNLNSIEIARNADADALNTAVALLAKDTVLQAVRDRLPSTLVNDRLKVEAAGVSDVSDTQTLAALNNAATVAVPHGATQVAISFTSGSVITAVISFEVSFDNATTYVNLALARGDAVSTATAASFTLTAAATNQWWEGAIPVGATHVRARISSFTSGGPIVTKVTAGEGGPDSSVTATINTQLPGGSNTMGAIYGAGQWIDANSTAQAANATVTGTSRDLTGQATATNFTNSARLGEYRVSATADVAGTLYLEHSRDNVTWRRIKSVALAAAAGAGTSFYGEIVHPPSTRYVRAVFINGATIQTYFMLQELWVSTS
jgi:hypothetical protein